MINYLKEGEFYKYAQWIVKVLYNDVENGVLKVLVHDKNRRPIGVRQDDYSEFGMSFLKIQQTK